MHARTHAKSCLAAGPTRPLGPVMICMQRSWQHHYGHRLFILLTARPCSVWMCARMCENPCECVCVHSHTHPTPFSLLSDLLMLDWTSTLPFSFSSSLMLFLSFLLLAHLSPSLYSPFVSQPECPPLLLPFSPPSSESITPHPKGDTMISC